MGVWFMPSVYLSSYIALPILSLLALCFGVLFASPSFSASLALGVFIFATIVGFLICYFFTKENWPRWKMVYKRRVAKCWYTARALVFRKTLGSIEKYTH